MRFLSSLFTVMVIIGFAHQGYAQQIHFRLPHEVFIDQLKLSEVDTVLTYGKLSHGEYPTFYILWAKGGAFQLTRFEGGEMTTPINIHPLNLTWEFAGLLPQLKNDSSEYGYRPIQSREPFYSISVQMGRDSIRFITPVGVASSHRYAPKTIFIHQFRSIVFEVYVRKWWD